MRIHRFKRIKLNLKFLSFISTLIFSFFLAAPATAKGVTGSDLVCTDIHVVFARGSGVEIGSSRDYQPFHDAMVETFRTSGLSLSFYELGSSTEFGDPYPAPGIGISTWERFKTSVGALVTAGEAYSYGESVETGADEAMTYTMAYKSKCRSSKIILAGYSQGAQVVSRTIQKINPSWIFAAITFGDPKLYLPEGKKNLFTQSTLACDQGTVAFSDYRAYVPDCYAYEGILGGYVPYNYSSDYIGKLYAYCQYHDVICSSYIDLGDLAYGHASYNEQGTYRRAAMDMYNKIFLDGYQVPTQDIAILVDTTASMHNYIHSYKRLAYQAADYYLRQGARVAVYTYGDYLDGTIREVCGLDTCSRSNLQFFFDTIKVKFLTDDLTAIRSASLDLMRTLRWKADANKSVIVFTNESLSGFDKNNVTVDDIARTSYKIDPVNFYIVTDGPHVEEYQELAELTGGKVYNSSSLSIETIESTIGEDIMNHEPSIKVYNLNAKKPSSATTSNITFDKTSETSFRLTITTDAVYNILTLNDTVLGYLETNEVEITDVDFSKENVVCLSPISADGYRGSAVCKAAEFAPEAIIPKAPNTGRK